MSQKEGGDFADFQAKSPIVYSLSGDRVADLRFILLMRRECEMKVRYAMFYNYHKLLNDHTTTKQKFMTFFCLVLFSKTFSQEYFYKHILR